MSDWKAEAAAVHEGLAKLQSNIESVVLGKPDVIQLVITALLAGEHVLLEDVPGVGKTLIAKALARSIAGKFSRIQFTPDLLPSDITGSSIYHSNEGTFAFNPGPIFANVVLADEINRAPPRTQSALLEAMGEHQVSVDGETHPLPNPLLVIATQNPFEFEGTYLLPESQLDRFLLRVEVGYPPRSVEHELLRSHRDGEPVLNLQPVVTLDEVRRWQKHVRGIYFEESLTDYLLNVVHATRESDAIQIGISTRGAISFYRACQAMAVLERREHVIPDDIKRLAVPVLAHRIVPRGVLPGADRTTCETLIGELLADIAVPV